MMAFSTYWPVCINLLVPRKINVYNDTFSFDSGKCFVYRDKTIDQLQSFDAN